MSYSSSYTLHTDCSIYIAATRKQTRTRQASSPIGATSKWQGATVHLHPQLRNERFQQALEISYQDLAPVPLDRFVKQGAREGCEIDASLAILCPHPLIEAPQPVRALVERWLALRPRNPISLEPTSPPQVFDRIRGFLTTLEAAGYLMIESPA